MRPLRRSQRDHAQRQYRSYPSAADPCFRRPSICGTGRAELSRSISAGNRRLDQEPGNSPIVANFA